MGLSISEAAALYQEYILCEASMMAHKVSKKGSKAASQQKASGNVGNGVGEELRNAAEVLTNMMYRA